MGGRGGNSVSGGGGGGGGGLSPVVVAKLDRLSRDVHFISGLMAHRVPLPSERYCLAAHPRPK